MRKNEVVINLGRETRASLQRKLRQWEQMTIEAAIEAALKEKAEELARNGKVFYDEETGDFEYVPNVIEEGQNED